MPGVGITEQVAFDVTSATDAELEAIKNEVLKTLVRRVVNPDMPVEEFSRHSSIHSRG